jgi:FkbM family methyltransferase
LRDFTAQMNLFANPLAIRFRTFIRRQPRVLGALVRVRSLFDRGYEAALAKAMTDEVRSGDCVWDVGANVGLYSKTFASLVGSAGKVVAFDPSPGCCAELERLRASSGEWLVVRQLAMGDTDGEARFSMAGGETGVANHVTSADARDALPVRMARGDTLFADGERIPNIIKIDVEGFEGEVIRGMDDLLARPPVRAVFIEMHFAQLADRGKENEPAEIVARLRRHRFAVKWVDASHIAARRA